jgi:hypothetical protein
MLRARDSLRKEVAALHRQLLAIALTEDLTRFTSSQRVGAHVGLTLRK